MKITYYPNQETVTKAIAADDPLLVLVSYAGQEILASNIDDAFEHLILLRKLKIDDNEIDSYFRLVVNKEGADWTFVCPESYKGIKIKTKRLELFYKDGFQIIPKALKKLGYSVPLEIPKRYRRHVTLF